MHTNNQVEGSRWVYERGELSSEEKSYSVFTECYRGLLAGIRWCASLYSVYRLPYERRRGLFPRRLVRYVQGESAIRNGPWSSPIP